MQRSRLSERQVLGILKADETSADGGRSLPRERDLGIDIFQLEVEVWRDDGGGGGGANTTPTGPTPTSPGDPPPNDKKKKEYDKCMKEERRKCYEQGRAYFDDNFYSAVLFGTTVGVGVRTLHAAGESAGLWAAFKGAVGQVIRKAGPYVAVATSLWAVRSLAKAGQAIEDACMTDKDELCRRRSGLL